MERQQALMTEEQRKLIEDNLPFCYYWFNLHQIYSEDKQQAMLLNLCRFIHLYDKEKGAITTFIGVVFQSKFLHDYKAERTDKRRANNEAISLNTPMYINDDGDEVTIADAFPILEKGFDQIEAQMLLNNICKNIKEDASISAERVELFFAWIYSRNYTFCGKLFNMPAHRVEHIIKEVYKVIRKHHLEEMQIDPRYKRFTLAEIKERFFAINEKGGPAERAVVVLSENAMAHRTKSNRSYIISSDHPFFGGKGNEESTELEGVKLNNRTGGIYLLCKYIKDEQKDIELCYLL